MSREEVFEYDKQKETKDGNDLLTTVREIAPWASRILGVEGGYHTFESISDYDTWMRQI